MTKFSLIIPVFNRPDEIDELLQSLENQTDKDFEVLIVEDGSAVKCDEICKKYFEKLDLKYFFKQNSGRSETRNYGMERANGNYFLIFDSDVILPVHYIETVRRCLSENYVDCFGGRDDADKNFTDLQKAVNYAMTSFFTTGGIRGGTKKSEKFSPRSFNMGLSREVFEKVGGYKNMIGEDIDLSIRVLDAGFKTTLFKDAYVFHKRRVSLKSFFRQVNTFGKGRVILGKIHKNSLKIVHILPSIFVIGTIFLLLLSFFNALFLLPILFFILLIFVDAAIKNRSTKIGFLSVIASFTQLFGYGLGMLSEIFTGKAAKKTQEENYK
ncbi:MAG: glycosyltransferase [Prevotellaceae bacterium]|jgi:glycosyltransferase involved in cell wall biosynthesis|nr:glycosyltransferase [Prevotellaceae bacterium]